VNQPTIEFCFTGHRLASRQLSATPPAAGKVADKRILVHPPPVRPPTNVGWLAGRWFGLPTNFWLKNYFFIIKKARRQPKPVNVSLFIVSE